MRKLLITLGMIATIVSNAQTIDKIDSLKSSVIENLDQYDHNIYLNEEILNEDAMRYDTVCFYHNKQDELVYVKWYSRTHTHHIAGDGIDITELFFINDKVVFRNDFGYSFVNPQWHLEPDLDEAKISMTESTREYYREDGSALIDYKSRSAEGKFKDRFTLLDAIPLEEKLQRRWSDRCDECIEKDYLSIYRKLLEEKQKH